jgi:cation diffusion facilitator CzcD-associated flavoprotein CzcO
VTTRPEVDGVVEDEPTEADSTMTCNWLQMCSGYYSYSDPYRPDFPGEERFRGEILHPQFWPEDLSFKDKNVVIIGSGATAITLVPAMTAQQESSGSAKHVTMLQRSPTHIISHPSEIGIVARTLAYIFGHDVARWFFVFVTMFQYYICQLLPMIAAKTIRKRARAQVGDDVFREEDFTPRYKPWDQRLCLCPDGDFFESLHSGKASIVTDHIVEFTKTGIRLQEAKEELKADIVVTATGLKLLFAGGIDISVDGQSISFAQKFIYKGFMLHNLPNLFIAGGYTNNSWTLKVDLTHKCACRLIQHMEQRGKRYCQPELPTNGKKLEERPLLDLTSGYVQRSIHETPKQSTSLPWRLYQNYIFDKYVLEYTALEDGSMAFY